MSVDLIAEDELREALRPLRPDPVGFEAGVRERMRIEQALEETDHLRGLSPPARAAAALLPLQLLGGKVSAAGPPLSAAQKLVGYLAFPAISLFVLLGATVFGAVGVRTASAEPVDESLDRKAMQTATGNWWKSHKWGAAAVYALTLALMVSRFSGLLFALYILSIGLLVYVVNSLARVGLGNRLIIAQSCGLGLMLLGQCALSFGIGDGDIHFIDQRLVGVVLMLGGLGVLAGFQVGGDFGQSRLERLAQRTALAAAAVIIVPLVAWFASPLIWPATPQRIKAHVESFDAAPFGAVSWRKWEIVARWTVEAGLHPDLSSARRMLDAEIAGKQNAFILSYAFHVGLIQPDDIHLLRGLDSRRDGLLDQWSRGLEAAPILSLGQQDWVIRALVMQRRLNPQQRDDLAKRLHATMNALSPDTYDALHEALLVTQLLDVIGRPVDPAISGAKVHDLLRALHTTNWGGFQLAGGFMSSANGRVSDEESTAYAVELMQTYGVPEGLDLDWVRSYVRPRAVVHGKWISAVTRYRLRDLPVAPNALVAGAIPRAQPVRRAGAGRVVRVCDRFISDSHPAPDGRDRTFPGVNSHPGVSILSFVAADGMPDQTPAWASG